MKIRELYDRQTSSTVATAWPDRFTRPSSVDNWRHTRMLASALPLIQGYPGATWMTVGDGSYGSDAGYLKECGVKACATSIVSEPLELAKKRGFIDDWARENAEALSQASESVDMVLCKEAYHHFPRPPVALYEMLRVARKFVVLIEPNDQYRPLNHLKILVKRLLRGDKTDEYEESGNFIYRINVREMEKLLRAAGIETYAVRYMNDFYLPRLASGTWHRWNYESAATAAGIAMQDLLARARVLGWGLCALILFKCEPTQEATRLMSEAGYRIVRLPRNPYLDGGKR